MRPVHVASLLLLSLSGCCSALGYQALQLATPMWDVEHTPARAWLINHRDGTPRQLVVIDRVGETLQGTQRREPPPWAAIHYALPPVGGELKIVGIERGHGPFVPAPGSHPVPVRDDPEWFRVGWRGVDGQGEDDLAALNDWLSVPEHAPAEPTCVVRPWFLWHDGQAVRLEGVTIERPWLLPFVLPAYMAIMLAASAADVALLPVYAVVLWAGYSPVSGHPVASVDWSDGLPTWRETDVPPPEGWSLDEWTARPGRYDR